MKNPLEQARDAVLERQSLRDIGDAGKVQACDEAVKRASDLIDGLCNADQRAVLRYRYLLAYTWQDTAIALECDMSTVFRRHNRALVELGYR